jgi:hypothetical protein
MEERHERPIIVISSLCVCVNPGNAFNCCWPMPFRKRFRMTLENIGLEAMTIFYQINCALGAVPEDAASKSPLGPLPSAGRCEGSPT